MNVGFVKQHGGFHILLLLLLLLENYQLNHQRNLIQLNKRQGLMVHCQLQ